MAKSNIEWTDEVSNPFTGCRGSCPWCYARRMARRLGSIPETVYARVKRNTGIDEDPFEIAFHWDVLQREQERLTKYRRGGKNPGYTVRPRRVFVGSMGDVCFDGTALCFGADGVVHDHRMKTDMAQLETSRWAERVGAAGHTILLLTKRPELLDPKVRWPANVHLGVSVTSNADAGRIKTLLEWRDHNRGHEGPIGPAGLGGKRGPGVLWASVEPLLDPNFDALNLVGLDWVVMGFQTGPGTRPLYPIHAAHRIGEWCADHGVPLFVKDSVAKVMSQCVWPREFPS